jgi:hypothetical protein
VDEDLGLARLEIDDRGGKGCMVHFLVEYFRIPIEIEEQ